MLAVINFDTLFAMASKHKNYSPTSHHRAPLPSILSVFQIKASHNCIPSLYSKLMQKHKSLYSDRLIFFQIGGGGGNQLKFVPWKTPPIMKMSSIERESKENPQFFWQEKCYEENTTWGTDITNVYLVPMAFLEFLLHAINYILNAARDGQLAGWMTGWLARCLVFYFVAYLHAW